MPGIDWAWTADVASAVATAALLAGVLEELLHVRDEHPVAVLINAQQPAATATCTGRVGAIDMRSSSQDRTNPESDRQPLKWHPGARDPGHARYIRSI